MIDNSVFDKAVENARKHRLVKKKKKKLYSVRTKSSYKKIFLLKFIIHRNENNTQTLNKAVFLGLSILELDKIVMYKFWYDYVKLKYEEKVKLFYMNTNSFFVNYLMVHCKTDDNYHTLLNIRR